MTAFKLLRNISEKTLELIMATKTNSLSKKLADSRSTDGAEGWLSF